MEIPVQISDLVQIEELLGMLHEGIVIMDQESRIIYVNPAYTRILGVPPEKAVGKRVDQIEPLSKSLRALQSGKVMIDEYDNVRSAGEKPILVSAYPVSTPGGIKGAVCIFRDITEVVNLSRQVITMQKYAAYLEKCLRRSRRDGIAKEFDILVGEDPGFVEALRLASYVAPTRVTILLEGETGTGKELFARAIHAASRRQGNFVAVNCACIPEPLFESELFGYEPGAFTGSRSGGKKGKFQLAEGGTLFLDEVGEIPFSIQGKLLRALQEGEVSPLGATRPVTVCTRVIAATNTPLEEMVAQGRFRSDLYYRLNVLPIRIPPLRNRPGDIPVLAKVMLERALNDIGDEKHKLILAPEVIEVFVSYSWPGNLRELENAVKQAAIKCILAGDSKIGVEHLPPGFSSLHLAPGFSSLPEDSSLSSAGTTLRDQIARTEKEMLLAALRLCNNNRSRAMDLLGISRRAFYKKIKKYGLLKTKS